MAKIDVAKSFTPYNPPTNSKGPDVSINVNGYQVDIAIVPLGAVTQGFGSEFAWGYYSTGRAQKTGILAGYEINTRAASLGTKACMTQTLKIPVR